MVLYKVYYTLPIIWKDGLDRIGFKGVINSEYVDGHVESFFNSLRYQSARYLWIKISIHVYQKTIKLRDGKIGVFSLCFVRIDFTKLQLKQQNSNTLHFYDVSLS